MSSVQDHLLREDPLTRETAVFLVEYAEEDDRLDYKETMDITSEKHWLELTKDVSTFANTYGGYLLFGVMTVRGKSLDYLGRWRKRLKT